MPDRPAGPGHRAGKFTHHGRVTPLSEWGDRRRAARYRPKEAGEPAARDGSPLRDEARTGRGGAGSGCLQDRDPPGGCRRPARTSRSVETMFRRWTLAGGVLLAGLAAGITTGSPFIVVVFAALAAAASPLIFPRSETAAEAQTRSVEDGRAVIYWRPGCPFCVRLRATLGPAARRAHWVDI